MTSVWRARSRSWPWSTSRAAAWHSSWVAPRCQRGGPPSSRRCWPEPSTMPPNRVQPNLPPDLVTSCLKCLEREPRKRYPSAEALAEDLRHFLAGEPILARPVGPVGRLGRWCRRNPALATATGLAAFAMLAIVALSIGFAIAASRDAKRLRVEQAKTKAALEEAERQGREAKQSLARLARHQGWALHEKGDVGAAMLLLAHSLAV